MMANDEAREIDAGLRGRVAGLSADACLQDLCLHLSRTVATVA